MVSSPDKKVRLFSALYAFLIGALVAYGSLMGFVTAFSLRTSVFLFPLLLLFDGLFVWLFYTGKEKIARLTLFSLPVSAGSRIFSKKKQKKHLSFHRFRFIVVS
ncbi:MAG: hypothetical protein J6A68_00590 [Oscillospiraceae bacterium]|nr:hypothetical protein [Oscillospiraceae bacterium]